MMFQQPTGIGLPAGRSPWLQPFSSTSTWNIGIGSGATWTSTGDSETDVLRALGGMINTGNFNLPYFLGSSTDPLLTVTCTDTSFPVANQSIHVPIGSKPAGGTDLHMCFFDKTQPNKMWSYYNCVPNNPVGGATGPSTTTISSQLGGVYDVTGSGVFPFGLNTNPFEFAGTVGSYNFALGAIRDWEVSAGVIKHALRCSLPDDKETWWTGTAWAASTTYSVGQQVTNDTGPRVYECIVQGISAGSGGPTGTGTAITDGGVTWRYMGLVGYYTCNVPWPDAHTDYCGGPIAVTGCGTQQYTGTIKYGRTIGIPASVNLGSLGLSAAGLMLATCIQKYGMYQRDSTSAGNGNVTLYSENLSGPNATLVNGAMNTDLGSIIVPQLRIMTNQTLDRGATNLNGGGTYPPLLPPVNTALVG